MWKEKNWYTVYAPALFGNCEIGETLGLGPEDLVGRTMETTLREVTGDFTQQHVKLYFQISDVKGGKAYTRFTGHDLTRDYVRMHVRRGTTRVDIITDVSTADGYRVRVRALAFTIQRVAASPSIRTASVPHTGHAEGMVKWVSSPLRLDAMTFTISGMTSPARWTRTVSPIRTSFSLSRLRCEALPG